MSYNFPNSPAYGDTFERYKWDGEKWCLTIGGRPKAPSTPPSILTGIVGWWDASVTASLSLTGANVNSIADQSASARTLSKSGNNFPLYSATGFNTTKPGITTVSTSQSSLQGSGIPLGTGNTMTAWYCGTLLNFANGSYGDARLFSYRNGSSGQDYDNAGAWTVYSHLGSLTTLGFTRNLLDTTTSAVTASPAGHRIIFTVNSSGLITIWVDGVSVGSFTSPGNWISGGDFCIGAQAAQVTQYGSWTFGEAGIATGFADATAVGLLDTYLMNKWGLNPATNFLARTSGLDSTHIAAYTALINGLVADGLWSKFDLLYIFATQNSATAILNLVSTSFTASLAGAPTFTTDRGYAGVAGSSTVYINTNFSPSTNGVRFTQNSAHISAWSLLSSTSGNFIAGAGHSGFTNLVNIIPRYSDGNFYHKINSANAGDPGFANSDGTGHYIANRSASNATQGYRNASSVSASSQVSTGMSGLSILVGAYNDNGAPSFGFGGTIPMFSAGGSLNSTEALAFYNRLRTYMTAVGVP